MISLDVLFLVWKNYITTSLNHILEDDNLIFKQPYKLSEVEKTLIKAQTTKLLDAGLVEMFKSNMPRQQWCQPRTLIEKPHFATCPRQLKMSFVTVLVYFEYQINHKRHFKSL